METEEGDVKGVEADAGETEEGAEVRTEEAEAVVMETEEGDVKEVEADAGETEEGAKRAEGFISSRPSSDWFPPQ
eukprot:9308883-Pyramimonas_sp.AAC.1